MLAETRPIHKTNYGQHVEMSAHAVTVIDQSNPATVTSSAHHILSGGASLQWPARPALAVAVYPGPGASSAPDVQH
jgi:hypothetical protein